MSRSLCSRSVASVWSNVAIAEFQHKGKVGRFCSLPKEGEGNLLMVTTEFAPKSHAKVALENLTLVLMPVRAKRTRLVLSLRTVVNK